MTNYMVVNYIDIVSNSLLSIINSVEEIPNSNDGLSLYVKTTSPKFKERLAYFVESDLIAESSFSKMNIIVSPCLPQCNWRNSMQAPLHKYMIGDQSIVMNSLPVFSEFSDSLFMKIGRNKKVKNTIWVNHPNVDFLDMTIILKKLLGAGVGVRPSKFFMLSDGNYELEHDNDVPSYLVSEIERELIRLELLKH